MKGSFSAWKEGLPYYIPFLIVGVALVMLFRHSPYVYAAVPFFLAGFACLMFFRDPPRRVSARENEVVCPADGTIVGIEDLPDSPYYSGPSRRVSIFLSVLDVHVNRSPFDGRVTCIKYQPGRFVNAMKSESSRTNESNAIWMDTEHGGVTVRQISGAIARRIVCRTAEGDELAKGEKIGMIKFGSRTELYLPPATPVCVKIRDKVQAGITVVARF
ncbi:MAG: phosphatidylserine decarboxylase family protein [Candidatus Hydrogenedentes bacterium]|nr:phosphatidylserine decarboxylase family protein [Candidatus Hydrogenedentota bacterium]